MKDYSRIAIKYGLVNCYMDTSDFIESYEIKKEHNHVEIKYMNGITHRFKLTENTKKELDEIQLEQLNQMVNEINPEIDKKIRSYKPIVGLHGINVLLNYTLGNWIAGTCWLISTGIWSSYCYFPYKLKKEINMVKWFIDNKDSVNQIIKEEVEEKMPEIEENTMIPVRREYPKDLVPYSENLYEEGINLSNIDELNMKQLKKLKKKALKLEV